MKRAERFFDRISKRSKAEPSKKATKLIELSKEFVEDAYVLDFGCGSGAITNKLARKAKSIEAIDLSTGMLAFAKKHAKESSLKNINYIKTDIFDERFKKGTFDVILAFNVLQYVEDLPKQLKRINSLLKPNGVLVSSSPCLKEKRSFRRFFVYLFSKLGLRPKISFFKKKELELLINSLNFDLVKSVKVSRHPEYFLVASKRR